jgi:glycerophosphoryl diester phosphodiesterase
MFARRVTLLSILFAAPLHAQQATMPTPPNPFTALMLAAKAHAEADGAITPALSPVDASLLVTNPKVDVQALHAIGIRVVPWTTNDPAKMRQIIALHVDGLISERPDLLLEVLREARKSDPSIPASFDHEGHRGGRGLRPENTLPAFEAGLDNLTADPASLSSEPVPASLRQPK